MSWTKTYLIATAILLLITRTQTCTVDNGDFVSTLHLTEEQSIGYNIGSLNLDTPSKVAKLTVSESNRYIHLVTRNGSKIAADFIVSDRIDVDDGLNRMQTMHIECTTTHGQKFQIEMEFVIEDINDHTPEFIPSSSYNFNISERALPGTQIGTVMATDGDIKNFYVQYEIINNDGTFELRRLPNGGAIIQLLTSLDYETSKHYELRILAKDCQSRGNCESHQKEATASVMINVKNEDDLSPRFDQPNYRVSLSQDAKKGDLVVQVTAHDQDDFNEPVQYFLSGEGSEYFHLDMVTGKVTVEDSTKLQSGTTFLLQVQVSQKSDSSKKDVTTLVISITSAGWDRPQFTERSYVTSISEYSKVNSTVLSIAINYDLQRAPLVVQIVNSEDSSQTQTAFFRTKHLGNNVDLILIQSLDYEKQQVYKVRIEASNGESSDSVEVTVHILNENDNNPAFDLPSYTFDIEYEKQGFVGKVSASDADNSNEEITYQILQSDVSHLFSVDQDGTVFMIEEDSLYTKESYTLIAEAADAGVPPRTANVVVSIQFITHNKMDVEADSVKLFSPTPNRLITYVIIGSAVAVVLIVVSVVGCFLHHRRLKLRSQRTRISEDSKVKQVDDPTLAPLCRENHCKSSLGLSSVINGRHENTYRDMSELNHDENYRLMWGSDTQSTADTTDMSTLKSPQPHTTTSSDSGRSSCSHPHSQSDCEISNRPAVVGETCSPHTPKRGYINSYLQEQRKRKSMDTNNSTELDNGFLVKAPPAFRTPNNSRPASVSASTYSDYAESNTSDYGSNTVPSETNYTSRTRNGTPRDTNDIINLPVMGQTDHQALTNDRQPSVIVINAHNVISADTLKEAGRMKPFTTFHGDLV